MLETFFESVQSIESKTLQAEHLNSVAETFSQLSHITSMIARYAVMENLYYRNPTMELRPDYKVALLELCGKILHWFANSFSLVKSMQYNSTDLSTLNMLSVSLWEEIKKMDAACQRFAVIVEAKEGDSESEENGAETGESKAADIEDISDELTDDVIESNEEQDKEANEDRDKNPPTCLEL